MFTLRGQRDGALYQIRRVSSESQLLFFRGIQHHTGISLCSTVKIEFSHGIQMTMMANNEKIPYLDHAYLGLEYLKIAPVTFKSETIKPAPEILCAYSHRPEGYYCGRVCFLPSYWSISPFHGNGSELTNLGAHLGYNRCSILDFDRLGRVPMSVYLIKPLEKSSVYRYCAIPTSYSFSECEVIRSMSVTDSSALAECNIAVPSYVIVCAALHRGADVSDDPFVKGFFSPIPDENKQVVSALVSSAGDNADRFIRTLSTWLDTNWLQMLSSLDAIHLNCIRAVGILEYLWALAIPRYPLWYRSSFVDALVHAIDDENYAVCRWLFEKMQYMFSRSDWATVIDDNFDDIRRCVETLREKYPTIRMTVMSAEYYSDIVDTLRQMLVVTKNIFCSNAIANMLGNDNVARDVRFPRRLWGIVAGYV